ncbi:MAG: 16S rRNA (guanine(966)-N(2))-methyltransferase RsmD [Calditrichia bacterium]
MRIISGKYKGQRIYSAKNMSIRPTTDRVKEYIFNILRDFVEDVRVLDLFSGAGSLGIEALSRGASSVTFVDNSYHSTQVLKNNLRRLNITEPYEVVKKDVLSFLRQNKEPFDLVFADPPYKWGKFVELLPLVFLEENLSDYGLFVLESERTHFVEWNTNVYELIRQKKFDRSIISFFSRKESE